MIPVIALEKVDFLPPDRVTDGSSVLTLKALVLEPMLAWHDGRPAPALFDRYEMRDDGRLWRLQLREGARYHDGTLVRAQDAHDFLTAILSARDMFNMPWSYAHYLAGADLRVTADDTLEIETPEAFPDLPDILSEFYLPKRDAQGYATIGTGPWQVVDYTQGETALLEHRTDGRRYRFIAEPDPEKRLSGLKDGRYAAAIHLEHIEPSLRALPGFVWHEQAVTLSVMAYLNGSEGPFADPALRLAANLAIDRDALVAEVMGGLGQPAAGIVSPWHMGFAEAGITPHRPDLERARALVRAAGAIRPVVLRTPLYMPERAPAIADFIARALNAVGFSVEVQPAHDRPQYARELGQKQMGDIAIFDSSPHSTFRVLDDKISSRSRGIWWQGVIDDTADSLFETARRMPDPATRAKAYGKVLHHLHHAPHWLSLFHTVDCMAHHPDLTGLQLDPKGIIRFA